MSSEIQVVKEIFEKHSSNNIFIISLGYLSRNVFSEYPDYKNILFVRGGMGLVLSIGLGMALNTDKNIVVLCGDGALLMHLGITHTIRDYNLSNLFVYILDNECYESVGGQKCSSLEERYCGITKIYKVEKSGKKDRVSIGWVENKNNIIKEIRNV